jgi:hypothetical protein
MAHTLTALRDEARGERPRSRQIVSLRQEVSRIERLHPAS